MSNNKNKNFHYLILLILPFFGGCGSPYLFSPAKYGSSHHFEFEDGSTGGLMGDAEVALYDYKTESVLIGWEHFNEGERVHNHIYRGAVKFNVGLLKEPPPKTVTKATLNYTLQTGAKSPSEGFILSCATKLYIAKTDWKGMPAVEAPDTIDGVLFKDGLSEAPLGSKISIDVTDIVKKWVSGKESNQGFVFGASKEEKGLFKNNEKCWSMLGDFTLKIDYTKP